jgi:predicted esterase
MTHATFTELYDAVITQAQRGEFAQAYALITAEGPGFPEAASMVLYLRSCMAERVGDRAAALGALGEALDQGHWYGELLLRRSPSWQPLQGEPAFEQLVARSLAMMAAATHDLEPLLTVPAGAPPLSGWPLLLTLHGNGDSPQLSREGWSLAADGWLQAALRSSQAISSQQYVWDDHEQARADVLDQLAAVRAAHPVDESRVVLAGFSRGAELALQLALTGAVKAQGVVLLGPGGPLSEQPEQWLPLIRAAADPELRAAVVIGEDDEARLVDGALQLAPMLDDNGIACYLEVVPGLGHAYPRDGGAALRRGLDFVTGR